MRDIAGRRLEKGQKVVINKDLLGNIPVGTISTIDSVALPNPQAPQGVLQIKVTIELMLGVPVGTDMVPHLLVLAGEENKSLITGADA